MDLLKFFIEYVAAWVYEYTHTSPHTWIISKAAAKKDFGLVSHEKKKAPMPFNISYAEGFILLDAST